MVESPFEKLENLVVDLMRQSRVPGMSIGVVLDGKPVYARGFGARNREKNLPMTSDTLWRIASISKSFCAMAIMQLVEKGKVDLHAAVSKYLDFKLGKETKPIAVHHLLSHSSGIPELDATTASSTKDMFVPMSSEKDFLTFVNKATEEVFDDPGEIFMYNNDMYTCLGFIVEKVTGMKYAEYVKENILKPLKMSRSTYLDEELEKDSNAISGYTPSKDGLTMESVPLRNDPLEYACGGLSSSVHELQNYMIALMNDGCFKGNRLLEKASIEKMWTPYIKPPKGYAETGYGYGWGIDKDFFGLALVHHGGNIQTSGGFLAMIPEKKMGVVVGQIPSPTGIPEAIARGLLATLLGKDLNRAVPQLEIKKKLEAVQGKYKAYGGGQIEVSIQEGNLYAKLGFEGEKEVMTVPLVIKDLKKLKFVVPLALAGREIEVNGFVDKKTGKIHFQADRYYYHKV